MLHLYVPEDAGSPGKDWGIGIGMREVVCPTSACLPTKKIVIKSDLAFGHFPPKCTKDFFFLLY